VNLTISFWFSPISNGDDSLVGKASLLKGKKSVKNHFEGKLQISRVVLVRGTNFSGIIIVC
jgi:hypothetical protein